MRISITDRAITNSRAIDRALATVKRSWPRDGWHRHSVSREIRALRSNWDLIWAGLGLNALHHGWTD